MILELRRRPSDVVLPATRTACTGNLALCGSLAHVTNTIPSGQYKTMYHGATVEVASPRPLKRSAAVVSGSASASPSGQKSLGISKGKRFMTSRVCRCSPRRRPIVRVRSADSTWRLSDKMLILAWDEATAQAGQGLAALQQTTGRQSVCAGRDGFPDNMGAVIDAYHCGSGDSSRTLGVRDVPNTNYWNSWIQDEMGRLEARGAAGDRDRLRSDVPTHGRRLRRSAVRAAVRDDSRMDDGGVLPVAEMSATKGGQGQGDRRVFAAYASSSNRRRGDRGAPKRPTRGPLRGKHESNRR